MLFVSDFPLADLRGYHKNPRRGDVEAIKKSILANGVYKPIVVNKGTYTGREREVLAGNHLTTALRDLGRESADVVFVDVDDDQAARIVLADNRASDLGSYDIEALTSMLSDLDSLDGTLYEADDLDGLLGADDEDDEDEPEPSGKPTNWGVIVMCENEEEQLGLLQQLLEEGLAARALSA